MLFYLFIYSSSYLSLYFFYLSAVIAAAIMSVVPLMFRDWWDDLDRPASRLIDQHFGSGLDREDLLTGLSSLSLARPRSAFISNPGYYRPWRNVVRQNSGGASTVQADKDKFQASCLLLIVLFVS